MMTAIQHLAPLPVHVAIIMDGNGRWAHRRGLPRVVGHRRGIEVARAIPFALARLGVSYLTMFSFSAENWQRPPEEINQLMQLLREYFQQEINRLAEQEIRLKVIGQRTRLAPDIITLIEHGETLTAHNGKFTLIIALDYGARQELVAATRAIAQAYGNHAISPEEINAQLLTSHLSTAGIPDPDLIIRTSGEMRLSNFMLWQAAYAELLFIDTLWPDFTEHHLKEALRNFQSRDRRYGVVR